ncbi:MAG: hypothetical protein M1829_005735, partial [Trizodia sp. TS-e1964]
MGSSILRSLTILILLLVSFGMAMPNPPAKVNKLQNNAPAKVKQSVKSSTIILNESHEELHIGKSINNDGSRKALPYGTRTGIPDNWPQLTLSVREQLNDGVVIGGCFLDLKRAQYQKYKAIKVTGSGESYAVYGTNYDKFMGVATI